VSVLLAVRLLRLLRPLRLVKFNKGLQMIVDSLILAAPTLLNMVMIAGLFYFGFSVLLVSLLKGALFACSLDPHGNLRPDIETKQDCLDAGGLWINKQANFDHVGNSLLCLLQLGTGEGLIDMMASAANSRGIDMTPRPLANLQFVFILGSVFCLLHFFIVNLFVGVMVDQYWVNKASLAGLDVLSLQDRRWLLMQEKVFLDPKVLISNVGQHRENVNCLKVILKSRIFEMMVVVSIVVNVVCMAILTPTQDKEINDIAAIISLGCVGWYAFEALVKISIDRRDYFRHGWNVFDFGVLVASFGSLLGQLTPRSDWARLLLALRSSRVVRLSRYDDYLKVMVKMLAKMSVGLTNVCGLLALVFFMFACLGVGLFGTVALGDHLSPNCSFRTFGGSMLLLLRVATGESWHLLMYDVVTDRPGCTTSLQTHEDLARDGPRGCGKITGYPFFIVYILAVNFVLMKLIIAVVLDVFAYVQDNEALNEFRIEMNALHEGWKNADPNCEGLVHLDTVIELLMSIGQPVGFNMRPAHRLLFGLRTLPLYGGSRVHLRDLVELCARRSYLWLVGDYEMFITKPKFDPVLYTAWDVACTRDTGCDQPTGFFVGHLLIARRLSYILHERKLLAAQLDEEYEAYEEEDDYVDEDEATRLAMMSEQEQRLAREQKKKEMELFKALQEQRMQQLLEHLPDSRSALSPLPWPPPAPRALAPETPVEGNNSVATLALT
jgi:hypothetical protein